MAEESARVGDIVFAGDLVKVQHGTKYSSVTYFDFDGEQKVSFHRQHHGFDMMQSGTPAFLYWQTEKGSIPAGEAYDGGLEHDISAYAHISSEVLVTYYGNGATILGSETYADWNGKLSNETYFQPVLDDVVVDRTYVEYKLLENMFEPIKDTRNKTRYRLDGWKKNNFGEIFYPGSILNLNQNSDFYAQWMKVMYLDLKSPSGNGKAGMLVQPSAEVASQHMLDYNGVAVVRAQPNEHYHLANWKIQREDGTTESICGQYEPHNPPDISKYDLPLTMSSDLTVTPSYVIDQNVIKFEVAQTGSNGKIEVTYGGKSKSIVDKAEVICDYNEIVVAYALPNDIFSKFAYWSGDVDEKDLSSQFLSFRPDKQVTSLTATFLSVNRYAVTTFINMKNAGSIIHVNMNNNSAQNVDYPEGREVKLQVQLAHGFKIIDWEVNGEKLSKTDPKIVVTSNIKQNYIVKLYVDTQMIDQDGEPIVADDGQVLDYSK